MAELEQERPFARQESNFLKRESVRYWFQVARWSALILLVFEFAIRVFIMAPPPHEFKPEWGVVPIANSNSFQGLEGIATLHYLADGEIQTPFRDGISIVVLGDSTVQAAQVNPADNFVSLTEIALRERGYKADLHNLGRPEQSVADHVFLATAINATYAPKYVIVQVSPANFNLSYDATRENYFIEKGDGTLALVHRDASSSRRVEFRNILLSSSLIAFGDFRLEITTREMRTKYAGFLSRLGIAEPETLNAAPENVPNETEWERGSRVFQERVFPQVQALIRAYPNSKIIFLVIPYVPSISASSPPKVSWLSPMDQALALFLSQMDGVQVVYTRQAFQEFYEQYDVLPRGSINSRFNYGHLNGYGHQAVAQALTEALEEILK